MGNTHERRQQNTNHHGHHQDRIKNTIHNLCGTLATVTNVIKIHALSGNPIATSVTKKNIGQDPSYAEENHYKNINQEKLNTKTEKPRPDISTALQH